MKRNCQTNSKIFCGADASAEEKSRYLYVQHRLASNCAVDLKYKGRTYRDGLDRLGFDIARPPVHYRGTWLDGAKHD
jgi:hypothetical protein